MTGRSYDTIGYNDDTMCRKWPFIRLHYLYLLLESKTNGEKYIMNGTKLLIFIFFFFLHFYNIIINNMI